jgi:hypothetical protein
MNFEGFIRNDFEMRSISFGVNNGPVVLQQLAHSKQSVR